MYSSNSRTYFSCAQRNLQPQQSVIPTGADHREGDDLRSGGTCCLFGARIRRGRAGNSRHADKKRPALVLTRNSAIAYLSTVTVAPVTSTIRGVPSEVVLNEEDGMKSPCAVNLHNAVTVSQQRLGKRVAQLSSARMNEVCAALRFSLGCDGN